MPCIPIKTPGGFGFACTRGGRQSLPKCHACGKPAGWLCDFQVTERRTCDRPICRDCATSGGKDIDYCKDCAFDWPGVKP